MPRPQSDLRFHNIDYANVAVGRKTPVGGRLPGLAVEVSAAWTKETAANLFGTVLRHADGDADLA